jgi:uncharacterized membrane protein
MAFIGPVVRNEIFFFAAILGVAALLVMWDWLVLPNAAVSGAVSEAERNRLVAERRREARWMVAAGASFVLVTLILTADFLYARTAAAAPEAQTLAVEGGEVHVPTVGLSDGSVHFFRTEVDGTPQDFMVFRQPDGHWLAAIAGCMICGRHGYRQEGMNVICRNCGAEIPISTLGQVGGCNPIPVPSRLESGALVLQASDLGRPVQVPQ